MAFHDIARHGYQRTLAGSWDLGGGDRLAFLIDEPRALRCEVEILARTSALTDSSGSGAKRLAALLVASGMDGDSTADLHGAYLRVRHPAFGLGGPAAPPGDPFAERSRATFREAMAEREGPGGGSLAWIADACSEAVGARPYWTEDPSWWHSGVIVVPLSGNAGPPAQIAVLHVRTDVPGTLLAVEATILLDGRAVASVAGVFDRADADLPADAELAAR